MISKHHQDQAGSYALGSLTGPECGAFEAELRVNAELREFACSLMRAATALALTAPGVELPRGLKSSILQRVDAPAAAPAGVVVPSRPMNGLAGGLSFMMAAESTGWKQLPIPGAWIKLLSIERERGYAVLLGKLDPGTRYPAHVNAGPEDFYILTGDLHVSATVLRGGDFHHAEAGSQHEENFSENGCTLLAVLTTDDPLVTFAMA